MNFKLLTASAVIATALAPAAHAVDVTPFGVLDYAVRSTDGETSMVSGSWLTSRIGVKASEDIGNGLSAQVLLDGKLDANNGTVGRGDRFFNRESSVTLSHTSLGSVKAGLYDLTSASEVDTFVGFGNMGNFTHFMGRTELGWDRESGISYKSPNIAGVTVEVGHGSATATLPAVNSVSATATVAGVGLIVGQETAGEAKQISVGARYDFVFAALGAAYADDTAQDGAKRTYKTVNGSIPFGDGFALRGVYHVADASGVETDQYSVGVTKDFSKRTRLAAVYQDNSGNSAKDFFQVQLIHRF